MIKLKVNNQMSIEITQQKEDNSINVDMINSDGSLDYWYTISAGDMVMLLNYYKDQERKGLPIL